MATYRGRLEEGRRFKGVQVTLYKPDGAKIDATTSDMDGFYSFTSLKTGIYHVRFEGRDYDPAKYLVIFVAEDGSNIIYYIRANDGATIKNSTGTLSLDLIELKNGEYSDVTEGNVKLYYKTGVSSYAILSSLAGVTASDYSATEILPSAFSDKLEVVAIKDFGTADEFVIDGITLLNLSDGAQGPGILYIGEWADIAANRELNNNGLAIDVVSLSGTYYAWRGADVTVKSGASLPTTGLPDWEEFESFSAIATGLLIAEKSYIKETVTIGTNAEGTAANITIWGGDTNPYISIGQPAGDIGYNELGIWAGTAAGIAKLSMKSASGSLLWDGTNLDATGRIFAQAGGTIAGWDIGADYISKNGVYLSSVLGQGGLYIDDSGTKRLQIGDFATISPTETNVWQGTLSSSNSSVAGTIAVGTSGGVSETTEITFTFITSDTGYSEAYAIINVPNIVSGGTISVSFDLESPTYLPDYMGGGLWPTYKPQLIVEGSYNSGTNAIPELYLFHTSSNWYPTTTKHLVSFNNSGSLLSNSRLKFTAKAKFTSAGGVVWKIKNLKIYNSVPKANFTKDQVLLYVSPQNYLQWTKSALTVKGGNLDVGAISAGSVLISGDLIVQGETIISGELSSHPTISAATSVNNSNGYVIQDLTFDSFGHVTGTVSTDLDARFVKLSQASQSITGDLTITGNVTISGGLTTVNTTTVTTSDNLIIINNGEVGAGVTGGTAGIQVDRGTLTDYQFMFRESDDSFVIGEIGSLQKVATRQDTPISMGAAYWNNSTFNFDTSANFLWDEANKRVTLSNGGGNYVGIRFLRTATGQHDAEIALVDGQLSFNHDPNTGTYVTHAYITSTGFHLGSAASAGTHAVRADRTISLTGTANQVTVTGTTAQALTSNVAWTLSLPQNIHAAATPTFDALTLTGSTNSTILLSGPSQMGGITIRNNFTASGGWARGFILQDTGATVVFGAGYYGSDQVINGYYIGTGASWWSNYGLRVDSSRNVYLGNAGTATTHAVRADRAIVLNIGNSLTRTGLASQNLTADPTYTFDTIQDIRTTANPSFAGLTLDAGHLAIKNGSYALHFTASDNSIRSYVNGNHEGTTTDDFIALGSFYGQVRLVTGDSTGPTTRLLVNASGRISIGNTNDTHNFDVTGTGRFSGVITSTVSTGTAPFTVASTTQVANLNADLWDGYQFADYLDQAVKTGSNVRFTGLGINNVPDNTYGRARFYENSTVNAVGIQQAGTGNILVLYDNTTAVVTFADGGATTFTNAVTATRFTSSVAIGTAPLTVTSTTLVTNLNADLWDGYQFADYLNQDVKSTASPTFVNLTLSGTTAGRLLSTDGSKVATSVSDLTTWIAGTANQVASTSDGDGSITLSLPQNIHIGATPTFAGLTLTGDAGITGIVTITGSLNVDSLNFDGNTITPLANNFIGLWGTSVGTGVPIDRTLVLTAQNDSSSVGLKFINGGTKNTRVVNYLDSTNNLFIWDFTWSSGGAVDYKWRRTGSDLMTLNDVVLNVPVGITTTDLAVDNITIDGNTISSTNTDGNIIFDTNGTGQVQVLSNGATIAGVNYANAWLVIGASNGIAFDDNEIVKFGGALNIATNGSNNIVLSTNGTARMTLNGAGGVDFANNTLTAIGVANIDEVRIGDTAITGWQAASPFVGAVAPLNIFSSTGGDTYQRLIVIRNNNVPNTSGLRRLGISWHLSTEGDTTESGKMGAVTVESTNVYANNPELILWTNNLKRLTVSSLGMVTISNPSAGTHTLALQRLTGVATIKGLVGTSDTAGALVIDGSDNASGHVYVNHYVGRNFYVNSGTTRGNIFFRTTGMDSDAADIKIMSQVQIEYSGSSKPFLHLRSDGTDTYSPEIYLYEGGRSSTTDSGFKVKFLGSTNRTDFVSTLNGAETRTHLSFMRDASRMGLFQTPDAAWNLAITGDTLANGKLSLVGENSISFGGAIGNTATSTLPGWYANDTTWIRNLNNKGLYLSGTTGNAGALLIENFTGSSAYASSYFGVGWKIFKNSLNEWSAEFDNLLIRNVLRAHIFQKDIVRATNGFLYIADASELTEDVDLTAVLDGATITIYVKEQVFQTGDLLWYKDINDSTGLVITGVKLVITNTGTGVTRNSKSVISYTATLSSGAGSIMKTGGTIVRVGGTAAGRGGSIFMDASTAGAPFIDIYNGVTTWNDFQNLSKLKARLGNISGVTSPVFGALQGYGLYTNNIYLEGNAAIAGTLTAGDANGFGSTFYAGKIQKNLFGRDSQNVATWQKTQTAGSWVLSYNSVVAPDGTTTATAVTSSTSMNDWIGDAFDGQVNTGVTITFSFWAKSPTGVTLKVTLFDSTERSVTDNDGITSWNAIILTTEWKRYSATHTFAAGTNSGILFRSNSTTNPYHIWGVQKELGTVATQYQYKDNRAPVGSGYGMWATAGGFGGTMQAPVVALNSYGLRVESGRGVQTTQSANSILIGNIVAHGTLATNAGGIRITNTGTTSTSGIFGHDAAGNPAFQLKLDGTAQIASFYFDDGDLWAGNPAIGAMATSVVISSASQKIALGVLANGITTANTGAGFYVDSSGKFKISDGTNFILKDTGNLTIAVTNFTLSSGKTANNDTTNAGLWISGNDFYVGSANDAAYIKFVSSSLSLKSSSFDLYATDTLHITNTKVALGTSASTRSATTASAGGYIGADGTFGFYIDGTNYIRSNSGLQIASSNFDLRGGSPVTLHVTNSKVALGTDASTRVQNTASSGIYLGADGQFGFYIDGDNYLRRNGSDLQFASESITIRSGRTALALTDTAAGMYMNTTGFIFSSGTNTKYILWDGTDLSFVAGNASMTTAGDITASNVNLTGTINASAGTFSNSVYVGATSSRIIIDGTNKLLKSESYSAGVSGWAILGDGTIDVRGGVIGGWTATQYTIQSGTGASGAFSTYWNNTTSGAGVYSTWAAKLRGLAITWNNTTNGGHLIFGEMAATASTVKTGYYGIQMMDDAGTEFFALGSLITGITRTPYNRIAGFYFGGTSMWAGNAAIGSATTVLSTTKIAIGAAANTISTTAGTGFYADSAGKFKVGTASEYIRFNETSNKLEIAAGNITLTAAGALTVSGTVNASAGNFTGYVTAGAMRFGADVSGTDDGIWIDANDYWYASGNFSMGNGNITWNGTTLAITANLTANSGTIAGWTISDTALYTGTKTLWSDTNAGVNISPAGIGVGNNVFTVNGSTGALTATSATITGVITANTGRIGGATGWLIAADTISSTGITLTNHATTASSASIRLGAASALGTGNGVWMDGAGNFRIGDPAGSRVQWSSSTLTVTGVVNINGASTFTGSISVNSGGLTMNGGTITAGSTTLNSSGITANQGTVGGWTLASGSLTGGNAVLANTGVLTLGTGDDVAIVSAVDSTYRFWAGNTIPASAPFKVSKSGTMYAANAVMEQVTYSNIVATGLILIDSGNASTFYKTFTATGAIGGTQTYTLLDLSSLSTTTSYIRILTNPTYPIAAIKLPAGIDVNYSTSITIECANLNSSDPKLRFFAWVGTSTAPMSMNDTPAIADYERIAVDPVNWAFNLFGSETTYNINASAPGDRSVGSFIATAGTRYVFSRSTADWKLLSATTFDIVTLQKAYATELHATTLYATNVIAGSVSGTVYFNQILTSSGTIPALEKSKAVVTSSTGVLEVLTSVDAAEVGYLDGVTSSIQTQLNSKAAHATTLTFTTNNGLTGGTSALDLGSNRAWTFGLTGQALALHNLASNGFIVRTAAATIAARSIAVSGTGLSISNADGVSGNPTISSNATNLNTASTIVARDGSGNFVAGTITAALTGNASTATTLQNARTIAISGPITGTATSFNGSANITIPVTALDVSHANVTGTMAVDHGGTGVATLGANQVMYGNGTGAVQTSANLTFNGSLLSINGTLEATEKSFNIAHPTQPGKRLIYGVLEGPEHAVYCRGTVKADIIELPEEWVGLVREETITVQLTPRDNNQKLFIEAIKGNKVYIRNANLIDKAIHADYFIMGTRKDVAQLKTVREAVQ